jgi:hypothetical protein
MNVLYLGMADDITAPLMLVKNIRNIYVINLFDKSLNCHDGTEEGQRQNIRKTLLSGSDAYRDRYRQPVVKLKPSTIVDDYYYVDPQWGNVWRLTFMHKKRKVNLIYFTRNFVTQVWPDEIQKVSHVMVMGAYDWASLAGCERTGDADNIKTMLSTRTTINYTYYSLAFSHLHSGTYYTIRRDEEIVKVPLTKKRPIEEQLYPEDFSHDNYDFWGCHYYHKDDIARFKRDDKKRKRKTKKL